MGHLEDPRWDTQKGFWNTEVIFLKTSEQCLAQSTDRESACETEKSVHSQSCRIAGLACFCLKAGPPSGWLRAPSSVDLAAAGLRQVKEGPRPQVPTSQLCGRRQGEGKLPEEEPSKALSRLCPPPTTVSPMFIARFQCVPELNAVLLSAPQPGCISGSFFHTDLALLRPIPVSSLLLPRPLHLPVLLCLGSLWGCLAPGMLLQRGQLAIQLLQLNHKLMKISTLH